MKENRLGLKAARLWGGKSTLCAGCGHDAISNQIVRAFYEMSVKPEKVAKFSGIGCSSKTPAYFLSRSHGFNAVHGRMPAVATGAALANKNLIGIGVSGDGDTASIGLGQFMHMVRRNIPMIYIIENNGVYGLTKGQFSATADEGSKLKTGVVNDLPADGSLRAGGGARMRVRRARLRRRSRSRWSRSSRQRSRTTGWPSSTSSPPA
jgi:2-oxoglutarate/2-oxoacid ferredoxin oxidoreductase subunit beta